MITLKSYATGAWTEGSGEPRTLHDPSTGEVLGQVRPGGTDFAACLAHARQQGFPALQQMGFAGRTAALKAIAGLLHERRDELLQLSAQNGGNTRGDGKFDIDGATGTLAYYAALGKDLATGNHLPDGDGVQLGRNAKHWGQHVLVPRPGVALHINAFNFPAWGMAEKLACAILAGVPVITKPGTPSALLSQRIAELIVESGQLPEGAFQYLPGSVTGLLDLLGPMDCVAFTGSAATGALIRGNKNLVHRNVRVNIEADSINSATLAPDVEPDTELYELFLANLMVDLTQKAGQKCTAVRRILVPQDRLAAVAEELVARLRATKVGNPADESVRMGPVASQEALQSVRDGMRQLLAAADLLTGGPDPIAEQGYFVAPTLLRGKDPAAEVLHSLEVFGPCATLIPYSGKAADAAALCNRGGGGLVSSIYSDDKAFCEELTLGIAPWHGRVWIGSEKIIGQALGPGAVLPQTIHGGPGRAGGGEELGGLRGLMPYLQRTAVQGYQGIVARAFGPPGPAAGA